MRVLLVDESVKQTEILRDGLARAGHEVATRVSAPFDLVSTIEGLAPDIVVIGTDSPSRDLREQLLTISRRTPRPVVIFANDGGPEAIREAVRAGVSAYVVKGLDPDRVKGIIDVAVARFEELQRLRAELAESNSKLVERKLVERAKGILMKSRRCDEETAYAALRKLAMDRKLRLGEAARQLIDAAELLDGA